MHSSMTRGALLMAAAAFLAVPAQAQDLKGSLLNDFERQRGNVLMLVGAMPESGLRSAPTEGVRDFAQQIQHVVQGNIGIIQSGLDQPVEIPQLDPEVYLNSKDELTNMVNVAYDLIAEMIGSMSDADLMAEGQLFGQVTVPKWQIIKTAYEHATWTLGATIPYVRMAGGTPGAYNFLPST